MNVCDPPSILELVDRFLRNLVSPLHCWRLPKLCILFCTINSIDKAGLRTFQVEATVALRNVEGPDAKYNS